MKQILGIGNALVDIMTLLTDDNILDKFLLPKGSMQLVDEKKSAMIKSEQSFWIELLLPEDQLQIQFMDWQC